MAAEPQPSARILSVPALRGLLEVGPYQLLEDLRPAPFGTAYLAVDTRSDRLVFLKAIPLSRAGASWQEDASWEILLAETEALGRIQHRGIPQVLEVVEAEDCLLVAFHLVEGPTLRDALDRGEALDRATLIDWGCQLLDVLATAHEQGILHRHITEDTVLLAPGGDVVLTGFGLTQLTFSQAAVLPPEQMAGELYTTESDLYAVGSLLRRLAFAGSLKRDPLLKVLARATSTNPAARYESAAEMAEALRDAAGAWKPASRLKAAPEAPPAGLRLIAAPSRFIPPPDRGGEKEVERSLKTLVFLVTSILLMTLVVASGWFLFGTANP